jgi:hypothetical protein
MDIPILSGIRPDMGSVLLFLNELRASEGIKLKLKANNYIYAHDISRPICHRFEIDDVVVVISEDMYGKQTKPLPKPCTWDQASGPKWRKMFNDQLVVTDYSMRIPGGDKIRLFKLADCDEFGIFYVRPARQCERSSPHPNQLKSKKKRARDDLEKEDEGDTADVEAHLRGKTLVIDSSTKGGVVPEMIEYMGNYYKKL